MLENHLIVKTYPKANEKNLLRWKNYRVTVLQDRLFRVERSENKNFRDEATQSVWYRNMPAQSYTTKEQNDVFIVDTGACKLVLKAERKDCFVVLNGREIPLDNAENLLGTTRTLDECDGDFQYAKPGQWGDRHVPMCMGVCAKTSVAVIDDKDSLTLGQDGMVRPERADGTDEYVFAYGNDYRAALKALYLIMGATPMLPRYALGNWWSRYHKYTDKEYLRLMDKFAEREIPLTVATIDMDWHYSDQKDIEKRFRVRELNRTDEFYGSTRGWTGYTWNPDYFPDYKATLKKLEERNLKITLNLHPAEGVVWWEEPYEKMANAMGMDATKYEVVRFNIADSTFINAYFKVLHKPYEKDGVSFWWIDWQQGTASDMDGLDPLWALNHYHYLDHAKNHERALILSRYAGVGSHRYPLGFSGDTYITWKTLAWLPYFTATASNVGYTWWSHDIGGHNDGEMNEELYARFVQYGVFSPINRLHCAPGVTKEPWYYGVGGLVAEKYLKFRHRMIPYLYTEAYATHKDGRALVEPLYYEWNDDAAYKYKEQYLFGKSLMVAPVTAPAAEDGYARVRAWLSQGKWTDIFTNVVYEAGVGGREITVVRKLDEYPVFARAGAFLPLSADKGNACDAPKNLEVWAYTGDGEYVLYEDGESIKFTQTAGAGTSTITLCYDGRARERTVSLRLKNLPPEAALRLFVDGEETETEEIYADCAAISFPITAGKTYRVEASYLPKTEKEKRLEHAWQTLLLAEGENAKKWACMEELRNAETAKDYETQVTASELSESVKIRLKEIL